MSTPHTDEVSAAQRASAELETNGEPEEKDQLRIVPKGDSVGGMTASAARGFGLIVLSSAVGALVLALIAKSGPADGASMLSFVTMIALGIERGIEVFWTVVSGKHSLGGYWPFDELRKRFEDVEAEANSLLTMHFARATEMLEAVQQRVGVAQATKDAAKLELAALKTDFSGLTERLRAVESLAPGSARLASVSDVATTAQVSLARVTKWLDEKDQAADKALHRSKQTISVAMEIVAALDDNPARKIASIALGASAGMLISGAMGLNLFVAILAEGNAGFLNGVAGVLLTGVIVGLGSSPTHEVIKAVTNYKKDRQARTETTVPETNAGTETFSAHTFNVTGRKFGDASGWTADAGRRRISLRSTD